MAKKFTRTIENFTCEHCGNGVVGNGYTNHCPRCLWSKHVDVYPGDREEPCRGLMEPIERHGSRGVTSIIHKCTQCGVIRKNRLSPTDEIYAT